MKIDLVIPRLGESISEATISKWLKAPGDQVEKGEPVLEVSTDKVDSDIPAPESGVLTEILQQPGSVVAINSKVGVIDTEAKGSGKSKTKSSGKKSETGKVIAPPVSNSSSASTDEGTASRFYTPLVGTLAFKHGISQDELTKITGSGPGGKITKEDLMAYLDREKAQKSQSVPQLSDTKTSGRADSSSANASAPTLVWRSDGTQVVPMDSMRQVIAEHMVRSKQVSPHVYSVQEVDVTNISKWRAKNKDAFERAEGFKLSLTPFFLEATVLALQKFPWINCSVEGKNIILKKHINLGCAVAIGDAQKGYGLIVPVIRHAEERNLVGLARALNDLANRTRKRKLLPDEVTGGTFTVTNPGVFGTLIGTPIINQPQVAILCLGAIKKRPVVIDDMIAIREMVYLTLSYDHRVVDGALGGAFLAAIREQLENWDMERKL